MVVILSSLQGEVHAEQIFSLATGNTARIRAWAVASSKWVAVRTLYGHGPGARYSSGGDVLRSASWQDFRGSRVLMQLGDLLHHRRYCIVCCESSFQTSYTYSVNTNCQHSFTTCRRTQYYVDPLRATLQNAAVRG